jgi:hypothetical protein
MERKLFAWWPITVTSGRKVWLSTYYQHNSLYDETTGRPPLNKLYYEWTETAAEKTWRLLKESAVQNRNVWNNPLLTKEDKL